MPDLSPSPDPRRRDLPPDASLPPVPFPGPPRHPAANLEVVGALGSMLLGGIVLGLFSLDFRAWLSGQGFSGRSLVAAAALGSTALPIGLMSWIAGWRLRRQRGEEPLLPARRATALALACLAAGAALATTLGLPT